MDYGKKKRKKGPIPPNTPEPSTSGTTEGPYEPPLKPGGTEGEPPQPTGGTGEEPPQPLGGTEGEPPEPPGRTEEDPPQPPDGTEEEPTQPPSGTEEEPPELHPDNIDIEIEYSSDRSYLYIFGPSSTGKTVLISSILYYLKSYRSVEYGDTLKNLNNPNIKHEKKGSQLWNELTTSLFENRFPPPTRQVTIDDNIPRHINANLTVFDNKKSDFNFCFIDMAGEDLHKVDHSNEKQLPSVIKAYIESLPKQNLCFIYILDPISKIHSKTDQLKVFDGFIDLLDKNEHTRRPLLLLVSKWDLINENHTSVEDYIKQEYPPIWGTLNQAARQISIAEFSVGDVISIIDESNIEENIIKKYNPKYAEKVFNWFYKNQTGDSLISEIRRSKQKGIKDLFKK